MDQDEREIAARIKFTLAEAAVIQEHCAELGTASKLLAKAVAANDGASVMSVWGRMSDSMNYIGTMLNLRGSAAAKQYITERGD